MGCDQLDDERLSSLYHQSPEYPWYDYLVSIGVTPFSPSVAASRLALLYWVKSSSSNDVSGE